MDMILDNHYVHELWSFPFWGKIKLIIWEFPYNVYNLKNLKCSEIHVKEVHVLFVLKL